MLQGDLATVSLSRLLCWLGESERSGCLLVQQDGRSTRLFFRDGRVIACASDDPVKLLGQFLLFKGVIDDVTLSRALGLQEETGGSLRNILMEMGELTREQLAVEIVEKAEETILDLFEWSGATFWFGESIPVDESAMDVSLDVASVIARGMRRLDERERIRALLGDLDVVLEATGEGAEAPGAMSDPPLQLVYEAVDGARSIREVMLHVRGTEYQVTRRLVKLLEDGLVRRARAPVPVAVVDDGEAHAGPRGAGERPVTSPDQLSPPTSRIPAVRDLLRAGDYSGALALLGETRRAGPAEPWLREEIQAVEKAFVEQAFREDLAPGSVPELTRSLGAMSESELSPTEVFLVGLLRDRTWDIQSLLWISPMRSVDVLLALRRLVGRGLVRVERAGSRTA